MFLIFITVHEVHSIVMLFYRQGLRHLTRLKQLLALRQTAGFQQRISDLSIHTFNDYVYCLLLHGECIYIYIYT